MTRSRGHLHPIPDTPDTPDPFTPEDGYSPDQFMTPASNEKDHREQIRLSLRPDVLPVLAEIVASGQFEAYRSTHDVIRDATYHRIHYLAGRLGVEYRGHKLHGTIHHVLTDAARTAEVERMVHRRSHLVRYVHLLEEEVEACRREDDRVGLEIALVSATARLNEDWFHEPYRSRVQAIIEKAHRGTW